MNEGEGGRSEEEDGEVVVARRGRVGEAEGEEGTSRSNLKFANVKFHLDGKVFNILCSIFSIQFASNYFDK